MNAQRAPRRGPRVLVSLVSVLVLVVLSGCGGNSRQPPRSPEPTPVPTHSGEAGSPAGIYVSSTGDDTNDGRLSDRPLRTIARAIEMAERGDTVFVAPGTYHEQVELRADGGVPGSLTIRGLDGVPVLDGERSLQSAFMVEEVAGLVFESLELRGYSNAGIDIVSASDVTVRSLVVHDNGFANTDPEADLEGFGINVDGCRKVVVEDNDVYSNGPGPQLRAAGNFGTGINTWGNKDMVIRRNNVYGNIGGGILVEDSTAVHVSENTVTGNDADASKWDWWDAGLWVDGGSDIVVSANTFKGNLGPGIELSDEDRQFPSGYVVDDNVSTGNYYGIYVWNFGTCPYPGEDVLRLTSNSFDGNSRRDVLCEELLCPEGCSNEAEDD